MAVLEHVQDGKRDQVVEFAKINGRTRNGPGKSLSKDSERC